MTNIITLIADYNNDDDDKRQTGRTTELCNIVLQNPNTLFVVMNNKKYYSKTFNLPMERIVTVNENELRGHSDKILIFDHTVFYGIQHEISELLSSIGRDSSLIKFYKKRHDAEKYVIEYKSKKSRAKNKTLNGCGLQLNDVITFHRQKNIIATVDKNNLVKYENELYTVSGLGLKLEQDFGYKSDTCNGFEKFKYKGIILSDLYDIVNNYNK